MFGVAPTTSVAVWKPVYSGREAMEKEQPCGAKVMGAAPPVPPVPVVVVVDEVPVLDVVPAAPLPVALLPADVAGGARRCAATGGGSEGERGSEEREEGWRAMGPG